VTVIGVIADTHGLLRKSALAALAGAERILHIGDVGDPGILEKLSRIAPVDAVRGNTDHGEWADALPMTCVVEVDGALLYLIHILEDLDLDPEVAGVDAVLYGHTHRPRIDDDGPVMYLNPGSAGPARPDLPISVARMRIEDGVIEAEIVRLQ
jgi:hypothetical protein